MSRLSISGPAVSMFLLLALCGLAPIWLYTATGGDTASSHWWIVAIIILAGTRLAVVIGKSDRRPFEMVFWLFTYIFLGMAPYVQLRLGMSPSTTPNLNYGYETAAAAMVLVGAVVFMGGVWVARPKSAGRVASRVRLGRTNLLGILSILAAVYYIKSVGLSNIFSSRDDFSHVKIMAWPNQATMTMVTAGVQMGLLVAYVALVKAKRQAKEAGSHAMPFLRWVVFIVLLVCTNPISTPRYVFGTVILALLATTGSYATLGRYRTVSIAALIGMVTVFPLADAFRASTTAKLKAADPIQSMLSGDFDSFSQIINATEYVQSYGAVWGNQLLGVVFFWIPSSIWVGKPGDTGAFLAHFKGYNYDNLSAPLWAELFVNGGWVLLVLGMFLTGILIRSLDMKAEVTLRLSKVPDVLTCIVPFYLLILLRGSLLSAVSYLAVLVLCTWFISDRMRTPRRTKSTAKDGDPCSVKRADI